MGVIRVDPEQLRLASDRLAASAQRLNALLIDIWQSGESAPSYDGQFGPKVRTLADEAAAEVQLLMHRLAEASSALARKGEEFAAADQAAQDGFNQLAAALRITIDQLGGLAQFPDWLLLGGRPPWIEPRAWSRLPVDDRSALMEAYRLQWGQFLTARTPGAFRASEAGLPYLQEAFAIYREGLPRELVDPDTGEQIAPYLPAVVLFTLPRLPDGATEPAYDRRGFTRYQYQDLQAYIDLLRYDPSPDRRQLADQVDQVQTHNWSTTHFNLCGLDAVGYAVGVYEMMEAYIAFAAVNEDMLVGNDTAWTFEIRDLYREMGWDAEQIGRFAGDEHNVWLHWNEDDRLAYPTFENVTNALEDGQAITPLVGVDSASGSLSADPDAAVGHFVTISETMVTRDGTQLVRVYNSLEHREEVYTWEWFDDIWRNAGGNSGGQAAIARPPDVQP